MKTVVAVLLAAVAFAVAPATAPSAPASLVGESHQIENVGDPNLLRPRDASSAEGAPIVLYPHQDWKCMTWKFEAVGDVATGEVRLMNYFTHKTLYPTASAEGSAVTQHAAAKVPAAAEAWKFVPLAGNTYRIDHAASGLTLTASPDGKITVQKWSDTAGQKWKLLDKPAHFTG